MLSLTRGVLVAGVLGLLAQAALAQRTAPLATADVRVELRGEGTTPSLVKLTGSAGGTWNNQGAEVLPSTVETGGRTVPVSWRLRADLSSASARRVVFVYQCERPRLRLNWEWEARAAFGPVEHLITVQNLSGREVWLPMVDSLAVDWRVAASELLQNFYVEKGASTPSPQGTHLDTVSEGYRWTGTSSPYGRQAKGAPREIIPAEMVFDDPPRNNGWYAGIEFSGRTRVALERNGDSVRSVLGLNPEPGPFRTRIEPGGSFTTPTVFLGAFAGGPDGAGNQLRPWVRAVLGNPTTWKDPRYPLTVNNSWGSGMQVDEKLDMRMISDSKELGLEMFHQDAGWFRGVGDWYPNPKKFPHGLAVIADEAHRQGLRFGLWVDWTQAALDTEPGALNVHDPKVRDWLVADVGPDWKPEEFKGQTVDAGDPAAHDYLGREVKRIVEDYHLDMLEHDGYIAAEGCMRDDHPHAPPNRSAKVVHDWGFDFVEDANETDVSYHSTRAYYDIYAKTRREHPGLLFEICNDGGRMVDFGSAAHGDYFSITDAYDPLSNRRAFYDASYLLPPPMLESYVEKWPAPRLENFVYMLRSGMMGWVTIMQDTTAWTPEQHEAARRAIALYKEKLRPLIRDARLYHISARPDGVRWDGLEYWDPEKSKGVVYAFRGSVEGEAEHIFKLAGLNAAARYELHFQDGTSQEVEASGGELADAGVAVHLEHPLSSELIFIEAVGDSGPKTSPRQR